MGSTSADGLHLSIVGEALRQAAPDFEVQNLGFAKLVDLLRLSCEGTPVCVARRASGEAVLISRANARAELMPLDPLRSDYLQSAAHYRAILSTRAPVFRLPVAGELWQVARLLADRPRTPVDLGTLIDAINDEMAGEMGAEEVKRALLSFLSAGIFERSPTDVPLSEQQLTVRKQHTTAAEMIGELRSAVRAKIESVVGEVRDEVVDEMVPRP